MSVSSSTVPRFSPEVTFHTSSTLSPTFWSLLFPHRNRDKLRGGKARAAALLAGKALLEQDLGRLTIANARLEGEKAALRAELGAQEQRLLAQVNQEREAWNRDRAQLEGEKVALQAALGAQEEAGRRDRAQLEAQLNVARRELRELEERMARVRAATEL